METSFIQIVVNPIAGSGNAKKAIPFILKKFSEMSSSEIRLVSTKGKNDAVQLTRDAIGAGASMVVAVGGDGTINEVINGFFLDGQPVNPLCALGVINCGTGGGFAKTINLPDTIGEQIELLLQPDGVFVDLGHVSYQSFSDKPESRFYVSECQTGIGSIVVSKVKRRHKIFGGKIAFGFVSTVEAFTLKPLDLTLSYDDGTIENQSLLGLVVSNGIVCGGGMKLTPGAKLNDGLFDILMIHNMGLITRLMNLSKVYSGKHLLSPHFSMRRCKKIKVQSALEATIEVDGELLGKSPFSVEIFPLAIKIKAGNISSVKNGPFLFPDQE